VSLDLSDAEAISRDRGAALRTFPARAADAGACACLAVQRMLIHPHLQLCLSHRNSAGARLEPPPAWHRENKLPARQPRYQPRQRRFLARPALRSLRQKEESNMSKRAGSRG
jgi:hypothetical protein